MDSLIKTFHIDINLMIAQLVNFAVVFFVLYRFAIKPLMKVMSERTEKIEKGLDDAKKSAAALEDADRKSQEVLAQTRAEAQILLTAVKKDAEEKKLETINKAKEEVATIVTNGKNQLAQEKLLMVEEAKKEVVELVVASVAKVLGGMNLETMDKESIANIIKEQSKK